MEATLLRMHRFASWLDEYHGLRSQLDTFFQSNRIDTSRDTTDSIRLKLMNYKESVHIQEIKLIISKLSELVPKLPEHLDAERTVKEIQENVFSAEEQFQKEKSNLESILEELEKFDEERGRVFLDLQQIEQMFQEIRQDTDAQVDSGLEERLVTCQNMIGRVQNLQKDLDGLRKMELPSKLDHHRQHLESVIERSDGLIREAQELESQLKENASERSLIEARFNDVMQFLEQVRIRFEAVRYVKGNRNEIADQRKQLQVSLSVGHPSWVGFHVSCRCRT